MGPATASGGLLSSARNLLATIVAILRTRIELAAAELEEEKIRLGGMLAYAAAAFFFLGFGVILLALFMTVLLWDSHRLLALGVFTLGFLAVGGACAAAVLRRARTRPPLLAATLAELARDRDALRSNE